MNPNFAKKIKEQFNNVRKNIAITKQEPTNNNVINSQKTATSTANEFKEYYAQKTNNRNIGLTSNSTTNRLPTKTLTEEEKQAMLKKYAQRNTSNIDDSTMAEYNKITKNKLPIREQVNNKNINEISQRQINTSNNQTDLPKLVKDAGQALIDTAKDPMTPEVIKQYAVEPIKKQVKGIFKKAKIFDNDFDYFKDGYQFGDIIKSAGDISGDISLTAGGTLADVGMSFAKGAVKVGEGGAKLATGIRALYYEVAQNPEKARQIRQRLVEENDLLSDKIEKVQKQIDDYSIAGDTSDRAMETAGYMTTLWAFGKAFSLLNGSASITGEAATTNEAAKQAEAKIVSWVTGLNTAGHTLQETYQKQGTDTPTWAAFAKSIGSGFLESKIEQLGGFFGSSTVSDKFKLGLIKKIPSGIAKGLANWGINAHEEGLEEVAGYVGNFFLDQGIDLVGKMTNQQLEYAEKWNWDEMAENYVSAFIDTLLTGGAADLGNIALIQDQNNMSFKDAMNTYGNNIEESLKEESNSTSDEYKEYLQKRQSGMTEEQILEEERVNEEKRAFNSGENIDNINNNNVAIQYSVDNNGNKVQDNQKYSVNLVNDTLESTIDSVKEFFQNEKERQKVYKEYKAIENIQNQLNPNSKFKVLFDKSIAGNGMIVTEQNGNRSILVNPQSAHSAEEIVIHELFHGIKGTQEFTDISNILNNVAKNIKDSDGKTLNFDNIKAELQQTYEQFYKENNMDLNNLDIDEEASAFMLQKIIGDQKTLNRITKQHPALVQKMYDIVDNISMRLQGVDKETAKTVIDLRNKLRSALQSNNVDMTARTDYSILTDSKNRKYVKADRQVITGENPLKWEKQVENYINNSIRQGKDVNVLADDGTVLTITKDTAGKAKFRNEIVDKDGNRRRLNDKEFQAKLRAETHIDELAEISKHKNGLVPDTKNHKFATDGFNYRTAFFEDADGEYYKITMSVGKNGNINTIYNIGKMQKNRRYSISELKGSSGITTSDRISSNNSIAPTQENVNDTTKYSLPINKNNTQNENSNESSFSLPVKENNIQRDNKGRILTKEQSERFKNSVVRDNQGNLKTVYHGTDADFTVFNYDYLGKNGTANGKGFYLADDINVAKSYSNGKNLIEAYVDIQKPLKIGEQTITQNEYLKFVEAINDKTNGVLFADYGDGEPILKNTKEYDDILSDFKQEYTYGGDDVDLVLSVLNSANISLEEGYRILRNTLGYDGIIVDTNYKGETGETIPYTQYIPLTPEQIKDVNNPKPTDNPDIRYSLPINQNNKQDNNGRNLSKEQQEYFKNSKARNEKGQLETVYHGTNKAGFTVFNRNYNFYTNNKEMAQSYTGGTEMVDTKKLNNISEAKEWLNNINEELNIKGTSIYDETNTEILHYENEADLLKNLKRNIQEEIGSVDAGGTYQGYVNIEKPIIIDAHNELWSMLDLDNISIDGIDNIKEFLENEGSSVWKEKGKFRTTPADIVEAVLSARDDGRLDVDGIIIKNVFDEGGYGNVTPTESGTDYITFNSNQFKALDNTTPSSNPDIRYSKNNTDNKWEGFLNNLDERTGKKDRTYFKEIAPVTESIKEKDVNLPIAKKKLPVYDKATEQEYRELRREKNNLRNEINSVETEMRNRRKEIKDFAKSIFNRESNAEIESIVERALDKNYTKEALIRDLEGYSNWIEADSSIVAEVKEIKDYLRNTAINVSNVKGDFPDWNSFRAKNLGRLNLKNNGGLSIDSMYQELINLHSGYFDESKINPADQLQTISDWLDYDAKHMTEPSEYVFSYEENSQIADELMRSREPMDRLQNYVDELGKMIEKNDSRMRDIETSSLITQKNTEDFEALVESMNQEEKKLPKAVEKKNQQIAETSTFESITSTKIAERRKQKPTLKSFQTTIKDNANSLYQKFVNHNHYVDKFAETVGNKNIKYQADKALGASGIGQYNIGKAQSDLQGNKIGKSLSDIFTTIEDSNLSKEFSEYMYLKNNVDREAVNKPIFGGDISSDLSRRMCEQYEQKHPEFKHYAKDVYNYLNNESKLLIEAGLITQEQSDYLSELYPSYVPVERIMEKDKKNFAKDDKTLTSGNGIKKATGGNNDIMPLQEAMAKRTMALRRTIEYNNLMREVAHSLPNIEIEDEFVVGSPEILFDTENAPVQQVDGKYQGIYYENGIAHKFKLNEELYQSLKSSTKWDIEDTLPLKVLQKASRVHRDFLTKYSATFPLKNAIKDIQDVALNSKNLKEFVKAYPKAIKEMRNDGTLWNQYLANGGGNNSYFDYETGILPVKTKNPIKKIGQKIENANEFIEQLPRFTEYLATLNSGGTINEAMYNASEITTNFKRGGDITKAINRNGATFLNASVQGFDKFFRNFSEQKNARQWAVFGAKVLAFGIAPALANALIHDDDDDYQDLRNSDKDLYYLFKYDDGKFIRIPKGRMLSVFGTASRRVLAKAKGEEDAFDGMIETISNQVAPNNPLTDNVIAPLIQAKSNKSWFGSEIVGSRLQKELPKNQYDENTDAFSIWLGSKLNISPKKINYVIDQYSGGVGDILLPIGTKASSNKGNVFKDQFTTDSVLKNKNVGKFYETIEKQTQIANDPNSTDEDKLALQYLNSVNGQLAELYAQKREVQNSNMSNKEKAEKVREIQEQINEQMKDALNNYKDVDKLDDDISKIKDSTYIKVNNKWKSISDEDEAIIEELKEQGINEKDYLRYKIDNTYTDKEGRSKQKSNAEKMEYILNNSDWSDSQKASMYESTVGKNDKTFEKFEGETTTYLRYKTDLDEAKKDDNAKYVEKVDTLLNGNYSTKEMEQLYETVVSPDDKTYSKFKGNIKTYLNFKSDVDKVKGTKSSATNEDKYKVLTSGNYTNREILDIYDTMVDDEDYVYKALKNSNINMKEYLKYKQQDFTADKEDDGTINGKSISGSKKEKVVRYINSMNITYEQKLLLMGQQYKLSNEERTKLAYYIKSMKLSAKEKQDLYSKYSKMQGFTVYKNGRVTW